MVQKGDEVITKSPLWHQGEDVGDRLGVVLDTTSYVVVELYDYDYNPVKCFRHEVMPMDMAHQSESPPDDQLFDSDDIDNYVLDLFNSP